MTSSASPDTFATSYAEARRKFLAAAEAVGLESRPEPHPLRGRDGEALALDVVLDGPADARALLILSSGCHGVEGYCGSGIQTALLGDADWRRSAADAGVAVLYLHALNPYGFSWWRRTTQENVNLNRNFHDFSRPLPSNPGYAQLAAAIVPADWPPGPAANTQIMAFVAAHGMGALQQAISGGQYDHPQGIFYGGRDPTWSHLALRRVLREHGTRCQQLAWIDLHTGLGPSGVGERILCCVEDDASVARARAWWGPGLTRLSDGSSSSAQLQGLMWHTVLADCPQAVFTGMALEYGTLPLMETLNALRADQWLENHPETDATRRQEIKQDLFNAFFVDTADWKHAVLSQARDAALGAVRGMAAS